MKKRKVETDTIILAITVGIFVIFVSFFIFGFYSHFKTYFEHYEIPNSTQDIVDNCKDLELEEGVECLVGYINTIYKYKVTPDYPDLTFGELKEKGGDCKDYSLLYKDLGEKLGFKSYNFIIDVENRVVHMFTIISNTKGYCMLGGQDYSCMMFENEE